MRLQTRSQKAGVVYIALGLFAILFFGVIKPADGDVVLRFTDKLTITFDGRVMVVLLGLLTIAAGAALLIGQERLGRFGFLGRFGPATGIALSGFVGALIVWAVALAKTDHTIFAVDMVYGTLIAALPLIFGSLGGVLCERSGIVNINIEGQLLVGAFSGALIGSMTGSPWAGLIAAGIAGALMAALLALFAIKYLVDQVVLGVILNVLALGLTGVIYERLMQPNSEAYNNPPKFENWNIPLLSDIPFFGPALFSHNIFVYLALILVAVVSFALFRTRWGLRTRAVGEHPTAADTVGIRVRLVRYRNTIMGGLVAGLGGAALTIGSVGAFQKNMTAGKGFIALAAVIFGRWSPTGALLAALLFGFSDKLQLFLTSINSPIPSDFLRMAPYLATLLAVAGLVGKVRPPAADGKPYVKE